MRTFKISCLHLSMRETNSLEFLEIFWLLWALDPSKPLCSRIIVRTDPQDLRADRASQSTLGDHLENNLPFDNRCPRKETNREIREVLSTASIIHTPPSYSPFNREIERSIHGLHLFSNRTSEITKKKERTRGSRMNLPDVVVASERMHGCAIKARDQSPVPRETEINRRQKGRLCALPRHATPIHRWPLIYRGARERERGRGTRPGV